MGLLRQKYHAEKTMYSYVELLNELDISICFYILLLYQLFKFLREKMYNQFSVDSTVCFGTR